MNDIDLDTDFELDFDDLPLTILVGSSLHKVVASSLSMRRVLRYVANVHVESPKNLNPLSQSTQLSIKALKQLLAQTLLNALTFPMEGRRSTQALRIHLEDPPLQLVGEPTFWDWLRNEAIKRGGRLALQQARLQRLDDAQHWIPLKQLGLLIGQFEAAVSLQISLLAMPFVCELPGITMDPRSVKALVPPKRNLVRTPMPWRETDPPLIMGTNGAWFGRDSVHPSQLVNIQILGGTGSGKTASCVEPPLGALLNYEVDGLKTAMLVIDPKRELEAKVRRVLSQRGELDRLVVIGECPPIRFFSADCPLSATDRLAKCGAFGPLITPNGDNTFWHHLGMALLRDLLQLQTDFAVKTRGGRLFELMAVQLGAACCSDTGSWGQIREILSWTRRGGMAKLKEASETLEQTARIAGVDGTAVNVFKNYTKDDDLFRQFTYACQNADPIVNALSNPDIRNFVDLDALPDSRRTYTDIKELVEAGKVILFCPEAREGHRLAGKALKAKFFEAVFSRENLARPVAYVCDEAQRFITQDPESGEQNFLDRCRAYRAICVLASQSLASIEHELGSDNAACTALDIISSNTPTKFVMRTTDIRTIDWLRTILPSPDTQGPHVVDVRRPSQLRVGEAYSIFADGGWGLHRARLADLT
jgi:hypothetical protein